MTEFDTETTRPATHARGAAVTDRILASAHEVLVEHGYGATTIDAVAARAGVARATIYRRWPSKPALIAAAARLGLQLDLVIPDLGSFREEVRLYLMNRLGWFVSGQAARGIEGLIAASAESPELTEVIGRGTTPFSAPFHVVVERGIERGEVRPDIDLDVLMAMTSGPLVFVTVFNRVEPDVDFVNKICDLIVAAAAPPAEDNHGRPG